MTINCGGKLVDLARPRVMGIVNLTPDSFYDGGKFTDESAVLKHVEKLLEEGADFIDIGAMSSRPGAAVIPAEEELARLGFALPAIIKRFPDAIISVDTVHAKVAAQALDAGACIINDITAGRYDLAMLATVAERKAPFIAMHMKGMPNDMQQNPEYKNIVTEMFDFFMERVNLLRKAGVTSIIIDPGFGFGKSISHNYDLLRNLKYFSQLRLPILAGVSRKSMVCKVLKVDPKNALNGTTAANILALVNGANILRVHDVKEAKEAIKVFEAYSYPADWAE